MSFPLSALRSYFDLSTQRDREEAIIDNILSGVDFRGANAWVLVFAIFIASLGLNVNSTAVIIGAMLISPLMGPILGLGLSVGISDFELLKRSFRNLAAATLISIATATVYFLLTPIAEAQSELLARTSPTVYDVGIAFFGGAAGIVALSMKSRGGNVLPGVAIATALMPPLCTAGFGLATGNLSFFLGALYLYFINAVFIGFATYLGVRLMRFTRVADLTPERHKLVNRYITLVLIATLLPALYITVDVVRDSIEERRVRRYVTEVLAFPNAHILSYSINERKGCIEAVVLGSEVNEEQRRIAETRLRDFHLGNYTLRLIQGTSTDSILFRMGNDLDARNARQRQQQEAQIARIGRLEQQVEYFRRYDRLSAEVARELPTLFPTVAGIVLSPVQEHRADTLATAPYVLSLITLHPEKTLSAADRARLRQWLQQRVQADSVALVVKP